MSSLHPDRSDSSDSSDRPGERGQLTALFAVALTSVVLMVGLVVDGGYAWSQRRSAQNAADLAALAGTRVVAARTTATAVSSDAAVRTAINRALASNGATPVAYGAAANGPRYVNGRGLPLSGPTAWVGNGVVPATARGVQLSASRTWDPFFLRIAGISNWSASAVATATARPVPTVAGGPVMPLAVKWPSYLETRATGKDEDDDDDDDDGGGLPRICVDVDMNGRDDLTDKPCKPRDHGVQPGWELCPLEKDVDECPSNSIIQLGTNDAGGQFGWMSWDEHLSTPELCEMLAPDNPAPTLEVPPDGYIPVHGEPGKHNAPCVSERIDEWADMGTIVYVPVVSPGPGPCPRYCFPGTTTPYPPTLDGNGSKAEYNVIGFAGYQFLGCGQPCIDDVRAVYRGEFFLGPTGQVSPPAQTKLEVQLVR